MGLCPAYGHADPPPPPQECWKLYERFIENWGENWGNSGMSLSASLLKLESSILLRAKRASSETYLQKNEAIFFFSKFFYAEKHFCRQFWNAVECEPVKLESSILLRAKWASSIHNHSFEVILFGGGRGGGVISRKWKLASRFKLKLNSIKKSVILTLKSYEANL